MKTKDIIRILLTSGALAVVTILINMGIREFRVSREAKTINTEIIYKGDTIDVKNHKNGCDQEFYLNGEPITPVGLANLYIDSKFKIDSLKTQISNSDVLSRHHQKILTEYNRLKVDAEIKDQVLKSLHHYYTRTQNPDGTITIVVNRKDGTTTFNYTP